MSGERRPVVVSYDGSHAAECALRVAAAELGDRLLLIVSVWEPGLTSAVLTAADGMGVTYAQPSPEEVATVDRLQRDHAGAVADAGVALARSLGAGAEAVPARDRLGVVETICAVAEQRDASVIVVGSRGLGGVKARLLGSTTRRLLHDAKRPVLVVRDAAAKA
jgi:nucleotide-binding universal stress UspA family protein